MFFEDFHQLTLHQRLFAGPYLLTSAGHKAVVIFFVLSGYLICGSIVRSLVRGAYAVFAVCSESVGWNDALDSGCTPFGLGLGILGLALIFALAVAWATEFRTDTVRRWFERWIKVWQTRFPTSREGIRVDS